MGPRPRPLSQLQRETLEALSGYIREHRIGPTHDELARALKVRHKSAIADRLRRLVTKNWIAIDFNRPRCIRLLHDEVPVVPTGPIASSEDTLAYERIIDQVPRAVAEWFVPTPDFFLEVQCDEVDAAGLTHGDLVAIHRPADGATHAGNIVVVRDSDEIKLRRVEHLDEARIALTADTRRRAHEDQIVNLDEGGIRIEGVMTGALIGRRPIG